MVATVMYEYIRLLSTGVVCLPVDNSARYIEIAEEHRESLRPDCGTYTLVKTLKNSLKVTLKEC